MTILSSARQRLAMPKSVPTNCHCTSFLSAKRQSTVLRKLLAPIRVSSVVRVLQSLPKLLSKLLSASSLPPVLPQISPASTPAGETRRSFRVAVQALTTSLFFLLSCAPILPISQANAAETGITVKKIAYLEKGNFWLFTQGYKALKDSLRQPSEYQFEYPEALHKSPGWDADDARMDEAARQLFASDADIIVAAGTSAVNALLRVSQNEKPIIGAALADPVAAGLMTEDGVPKISSFTTEIFPGRWRSMYRVFHDVVKFQKLGIMYPEGEEGRIYAAVDDAYAVAKAQGFEIVEAIIPDENPASCRDGIEELHKKGADSFFISPLVCFDWSETDPSALLDQIHGYNMPTFARDGSIFVQGGALMGFSTWDFSPSANRTANAIRQILRGTPPASIRMIIPPEPRIAINLQTAEKLGITFPFDVLLVADEIYEKTTAPHLE